MVFHRPLYNNNTTCTIFFFVRIRNVVRAQTNWSRTKLSLENKIFPVQHCAFAGLFSNSAYWLCRTMYNFDWDTVALQVPRDCHFWDTATRQENLFPRHHILGHCNNAGTALRWDTAPLQVHLFLHFLGHVNTATLQVNPLNCQHSLGHCNTAGKSLPSSIFAGTLQHCR